MNNQSNYTITIKQAKNALTTITHNIINDTKIPIKKIKISTKNNNGGTTHTIPITLCEKQKLCISSIKR